MLMHDHDQEPATDKKPKLEDFWKLETLGISEPLSVNDDDKALQKFNKTVRIAPPPPILIFHI